jgi:hydrogenase maturation protease
MSLPHGVRVVVCGNIHRADDGAAIRAVGLLLARGSYRRGHDIDVDRCGELSIEHLLDVPCGQPLVIVDAAVGVRPGRVVTAGLDQLIDHPNAAAPHSSHALPINQVLGVVNVLSDRPLNGLFVGIGGADFGYGQRLSPAVKRGLSRYIDAIEHAIELLQPAPPVQAGAEA